MCRLVLLLTLLAAVCSVALANPHSTRHSGVSISVEEPESDCKLDTAYCALNMTGLNIVLKQGETVLNPANPCEKYKCIDHEVYIVEVVVCDKINVCYDGKAPYKLPGECCEACSYLKQLGFGSPDLRANATEDKRPKPNSWSDWSPWTDCSRSCEGGRQSRMRQCNVKGAAVLDCTGDVVEIRECNTHPCPVHGGWTPWTEWTTCSVSCSNGTQSRHRSCTNPAPQHGGRDCEGEREEVRGCFLRHCPVDCVWLEWSEWGECSRECGGGLQFRSRDQLVEKYGGVPCLGDITQSRDCNTHSCPIHGGWTAWSEWTICSKTCANGTQYRERSCTNPAPQHGGQDCIGEESEIRACFLRHCPVHCEWLPFSDWSACSKSCDNGTREREREFKPALHGGDECEGDKMEIELCNPQACPDPCIDNGHPCFNKDVSCTKITDTVFKCGACPRGLRGDGVSCEPVNECEEASPCFSGAVCTDLLEGYVCGVCPTGFRGGVLRGYDLLEARSLVQTCVDVNECELVPNGGCTVQRECENTLGSFVCGPCEEAGYIEDGEFECKVSNPCQAGLHNCQKDDYCVNHAVAEFHCACPIGMIGNGLECSTDNDLDDVPNQQLTIGCDNPPCPVDNCPDIPNTGQEDFDGDGIGDVCDDDSDNDGRKNDYDNCPLVPNQDQRDNDRDGVGNVCDNCPNNRNRKQIDSDKDGVGDVCDTDRDGDGFLNIVDVCPLIFNPQQEDKDKDGRGDMCDNCPTKANYDQRDSDQDTVGDACDTDIDVDNDGIQDDLDICPKEPNCDQADADGDGVGDLCDPDSDNDGVSDTLDNCLIVPNPDQSDVDGDGVGDRCQDDLDGDGVVNSKDVCPKDPLISKTDFSEYISVSLESSKRRRSLPDWKIFNNGSDVHQRANSGPGMLIGKDRFSSVEFKGTFFVNTFLDDDYAGFVFNYQSNKKFMLVSWKQRGQRYWKNQPFRATAKAGVQIQMVNSETGPSDMLRNALWHTGNTKNQVSLLYRDALNRGWEDNKAYRWHLQYSTVASCMRLRIYTGESMFMDTGCVCDETIKGGRLGLYVFEQAEVYFSNLQYRCLKPEDEQMLMQCQA